MKKYGNRDIQFYAVSLFIGILVGCACRLLDYVPGDTLWSFSSIQTLFGFWIITNTVVVLLSTSNLCAGISSFLYMFGMTLSFYGLQAILGMFLPRFSGGFRLSLFVTYTLLSIPCAAAASILYCWNRDSIFNSILYALPISALLAEAFAIFMYLLTHHTYLFQLLMDIVGAIVFFFIFYRKVKSKRIFMISIVVLSFVSSLIFPR